MSSARRRRWSITEHPASVGETYLEHLGVALSFAARLMLGGMACLVHAFLPFLFVRTGSRTVAELHERMLARRVLRPARQTGVAPRSV